MVHNGFHRFYQRRRITVYKGGNKRKDDPGSYRAVT